MDTHGVISDKIKELNKEHSLTKEEQERGFNADSVNTDLLFPLLLAMFAAIKPATTPSLEERVAYLNGKIDTLENVVLKNI